MTKEVRLLEGQRAAGESGVVMGRAMTRGWGRVAEKQAGQGLWVPPKR